MKRWLLLGLIATNVTAQVLRAVDPTKNADDINHKSVALPNANFPTLPQTSSGLSESPVSTKQVHFNDAPTKTVEPKSVTLSTITKPTLPQTNLATTIVDASNKKREAKDVPTKKARINERQIRAFTPDGQEELKKQLNDPH